MKKPVKSKSNFAFQQWIVAVGIFLFLLKVVAWYFTQSVAILTDALESIVNIITGFIGLYSLYLSSLPKDQNHPYGHGKIEFL
ncbi:MAG: cation diffusion facilitator family transporter, partial [Crocinitomicaceae bacterium]